jgi:uncharacterized protein
MARHESAGPFCVLPDAERPVLPESRAIQGARRSVCRRRTRLSEIYFAGHVENGKCAASLGYRNLKRKGKAMNFIVTPLYAIPLAAIFLILFFRVSSLRSATGVSFGDAGNTLLLQRIRQHGNFVEWVPFVLILMILAEGMGAPALYLHISGALLLIGRIAHPFGLNAIDNPAHPMRYVGNGSNILATANAMVCLGVNVLGL